MAWSAGAVIPQNLIVSNSGTLYLCKTTHTSAGTFTADAANFTVLGAAPVTLAAGSGISLSGSNPITITNTLAATTPRILARNTALGFTDQAYDLFDGTSWNNGTLTAGRFQGTLCGFNAGDVVNNIFVCITQAGSGAAPTNMYLGLYAGSPQAAPAAATADVAASSGWTAALGGGYRLASFALSTPYTIPTTGGYYLSILQVGSWGTTAVGLAYNQPIAGFVVPGLPEAIIVASGLSALPSTWGPWVGGSATWFGWN